MSISLFSLALYALFAAVLYKVVLIVINNRHHAAKARDAGCRPTPLYYDNGFLGLNNIIDPLKANREMRLPDLVIEDFIEMSKQEGRNVTTYRFSFMGNDGFSTMDPRNVQALLATQFKDFGLGEARCAAFAPLLGNGIFSADGKQWEHSRALLRPQFVRDQVADLDLEERHVQNLLCALPLNQDGWSSVIDIQQLFFKLTLDSATEFLFGESADSQLAAIPGYTRPKSVALDENNFTEAFESALNHLFNRSIFADFCWLMPTKAFLESCKGCHAFVDFFVEKALRETPPQKLQPEKISLAQKEKYVFLKALVAVTRDPLELRYQLISILLAGRDTTASSLGWMFMLLIQYPQVQSRLRDEVRQHFGTYQSPKNLTFMGLKSCKYLQYALAEVLRLYPAVPVNGRRANTDTSIPFGGGPDGESPVYIRKGQDVLYLVHAMHRRTDIWGADAHDFRPERWEGKKTGWEYLPFNGGPRICLGQQFALTEVAFVTVRLLQKFDIIEGHGVPLRGQSVKHGLTLTNCPGEGIKVRVRATPGVHA